MTFVALAREPRTYDLLDLGAGQCQRGRMARDLADSRPLARWLLSLAEWSVAEKCALILSIYLAFSVWGLAAGVFFVLHPERAPYLEPAALAIEVRALAIQSALTVALLVWALAVRRRPAETHRALLYAMAVMCLLSILHGAYAYGTQTRSYPAAAICGSIAVAAVLFERAFVRVLLWTLMGALLLLTFGEITGVVHYAPLLKRMPFTAEHLASSWMLGAGGISLAILCVAAILTYTVVTSWQERGARLVEAARRLAVAEQVAAVINAIDEGVVVLDPSRRVVSANDAFLQRVGDTRAGIAGQSCGTLIAGLGCAGECPTRSCLESGERRTQVFGRPGADGETVWEEVRSSPIVDDAGAVQQVVEVWRDISRRRREEAKMADAHRLASLGMLASGFSHELNTPLATVLMCVESILRAAANDGSEQWRRVQRSAGIAHEQLLRCRLTTQHFLRLASDRGAQSEIVDVDAAVDAAARLAAPTAEAAGVSIRTEPLAGGARVRGNAADLEHILLNLLLNAIQASAAGGTVRLTGDGVGPVCIRVSDDGPGIAIENQARIFEPFCSLRPGGTGLGLFLALNFARRWGADITLESTPGAGATFGDVWPAMEPARAVRQSA